MAAASGKDSTTARSRRRRLGRGLDSLLSKSVAVDVEAKATDDSQPEAAAPPKEHPQTAAPAAIGPHARTADAADGERDLRMIPLEAIQPGAHQPRRTFDEQSLRSLAESIRSAGVMQPVVLRPSDEGKYELVAGERRWRAAAIAGIPRIPAIVHEVDEQTAAELALVENLQREDLTPIERAEAFRRLANSFGLTHQQIAERVGLNRASVTNYLRLLELDEPSREALESGRLTLGHARALLAITSDDARRSLARRAVASDWSVRELERRIRQQGGDQAAKDSRTTTSSALPPHLEDLQRRLGEHLGTKVRIQPGRKKGTGRLVIDFYTFDEFEGLLERLRFHNEER